MSVCKALKIAHELITKHRYSHFFPQLLILVSFLSLSFVGSQSPSSSCSFLSHFVIGKIRVNGLKRGWNPGSGIREVSWKMACGIEEINIWETTSRICRSDGSTCRYYPFYFVVAVAIFRFSALSSLSFFLWHQKFPLALLFHTRTDFTRSTAQYLLRTVSSMRRYYVNQVHVLQTEVVRDFLNNSVIKTHEWDINRTTVY